MPMELHNRELWGLGFSKGRMGSTDLHGPITVHYCTLTLAILKEPGVVALMALFSFCSTSLPRGKLMRSTGKMMCQGVEEFHNLLELLLEAISLLSKDQRNVDTFVSPILSPQIKMGRVLYTDLLSRRFPRHVTSPLLQMSPWRPICCCLQNMQYVHVFYSVRGSFARFCYRFGCLMHDWLMQT